MLTHTNLHPRLIVSDPDRAFDFYQKVLGAEMIERFEDHQNRVVHLAFSVGQAVLSMTQSVREWVLLDPISLGGSPCLLHLSVDNPDEVASRFAAEKGEVLIPIEDRPYGKREGRVSDPAGHLWVLSKTIEALDPAEISQLLNKG